MKTLILALAVMGLASEAFARVGSPTKIRCDLASYTYKEDITKLMDLNDLLRMGDFTYAKVQVQDITCDTYQGEVTTCASEIEKSGIYVRYHFNSQNGALEIEDQDTGQSAYTLWLNQEDVTKSGYLLSSTKLTNRRGGLMGSKKVYRVEAGCWAIEWKK